MVVALHDEPLSWAAAGATVAQTWTRGIVHGPQSSYYLSGPKPSGATVGVSIRAGAAGALLGVPGNQFGDRHVPLDDIWGVSARRLHEKLVLAATPEAAFALLESEFLYRLHGPHGMHAAVARALREFATTPRKNITQIQLETGQSPKRFIALFREAVGLTPKQFRRIQRFGSVLQRRAAHETTMTLAALAIEAGYSDQAHLTREFREFAGITPTRYRPIDAVSPFHHQVGEIAPQSENR